VDPLAESAARLIAQARLDGFNEASCIAYEYVSRDVQEQLEDRGRELEDEISAHADE